MSTPFPLEEQDQQDSGAPQWDPWKGPVTPRWNAGLGFNEDTAYLGPFYQALAGAGTGANKGIEVLAGAARQYYGAEAGIAHLVGIPRQNEFEAAALEADQMKADAHERVQKMTPDPSTTGAAAQVIRSLSEGAYLVSTGSLTGGAAAGAALLGGAEGTERFAALKDQGVDPTTAAAASVVTGLASAAGAVMPAGYGASLLSKVVTGAASNAAFGVVNRYADHKILELGGYPEMADQEKTWDGLQLTIDAMMGAGFGTLAHVMSRAEAVRLRAAGMQPGAQDALLAANLALHDRRSGPVIPITPGDANAHAAALQTSLEQLTNGEPVNVQGTGIEDSSGLTRPRGPDTEAREMFADSIKEADLGEEASSRFVEPDREDIARLPEEARAALEAQYGAAREAKPDFDQNLQQIADRTGGNAVTTPLKGSKKAVDKVIGDYGGDPTRITDLLRGTIEAKSPDHMNAIAEEIRNSHEVVSEKNRAESPGPDGYRDMMFKVRTENGHTAEIQVSIPAMMEAKNANHALYDETIKIRQKAAGEKRRLNEDERAQIDALNKRQKKVYDLAWKESTKSSQASGEIPAPLRMSEAEGKGRGEGSNAITGAGQRGSGGPAPISATGTPSTSHTLEPLGKDENVRPGEERLGAVTKSPPTDNSIAGKGANQEAPSPLETMANQALAERPEMRIVNDDGELVSAADALREANEAIAQAQKDAPSLYQAAVQCFMRNAA